MCGRCSVWRGSFLPRFLGSGVWVTSVAAASVCSAQRAAFSLKTTSFAPILFFSLSFTSVLRSILFFFHFHSVSCHLPALPPPQTLLLRNRHTQPTRTTPPYLKNRTDTRDSRNTRRGFFRNPVGKSGVHKGPESLKSKQTFNKSGSPFPGPSSSAVSPSSPPLSTATKNVVHIPRPEAPGCPPRRRGR